MEKLKQKTTWLGIVSIIATIVGYLTGAVPVEVAVPAIGNGFGLVVADA